MVLPVTLDYHAEETAIDFVARLAAANGFPTLRSFLGHTDVTATAIVQGEAYALLTVCEWSGVSVSRLKTLAVKSFGAGGTWQMGRATLSKDMRPGRTYRFCAQCVLHDRERMAGRLVSRAYRRAWWSIRGINGCDKHDSSLTEVSAGSEADVHDFPRFVEANLAQIQQAAVAPTPTRQPTLDRYLRDRVFQGGEARFLDGLDAHVVSEFSRYLGDFLVLHKLRHRMPDAKNVSEWGFLVMFEGEATIREVFAEAIACDPPKKKKVETALGPMVHWLRRNLAKDAYQPIVNLVQDILVRNIPFGPGDNILKPVGGRYLHSVITAQEEFGLTPQRIRTLMQEHDPSFRPDRPDAQTYFDAGIAGRVLRSASETYTSKETADILGVTEQRMQDLLEAGVLGRVEMRSGDDRAYTRVKCFDVTALKDRLIEKMPKAARAEVGLISLAAAARSWRRPYHNIVSMILHGTLQAYTIDAESPVLQRARVRPDGLNLDVGPMAGGNDEWMRTKEVERVLGTTTATVSKLIELGFLKVQNFRRETGRTVKLVERQSVQQFGEVYASLSDIAKTRQGFRAAIKAELDAAGVAPIFEPTGFIARFYRKSDVSKIG